MTQRLLGAFLWPRVKSVKVICGADEYLHSNRAFWSINLSFLTLDILSGIDLAPCPIIATVITDTMIMTLCSLNE